MLLPRKRRTSRRHTSKRRQPLSNSFVQYNNLEPRNLLATFVVNTTADIIDAEDGLLSLREAVTAANTNETFSDAPAGEPDGDRVVFAKDAEFSRFVVTQGELVITDDLIIRGNGIETGSIHGASRNRLFNVNTSERVQFRNLLMVGGRTDGDGGMINVNSGGNVVVFDSFLGTGNARAGGAINVVDSRLFVRGTEFQNNSSEDGGAIAAANSDVRIVNSEFEVNRASSLGGAIHATGGVLGLYGSNFGGSEGGNVADVEGGAVYVGQSSEGDEGVLVSDSYFAGNAASKGGAVYAGANTSTFVIGGSFDNNGMTLAESDNRLGGAIFSEGNGLYISEASFYQNQAYLGGAIYSDAPYTNFRPIEVRENVTSSNDNIAAGGGLVLSGVEAYLSDSTIADNETEFAGGGIGVDYDVRSVKVVLRRVNVSGNSAGQSGGGIYSSLDATLKVYGSTVSGNVSGERGGGISTSGTDFVMTGSTVTENRVTEGIASGGGVEVAGGTALVFDSSISNNTSAGTGGGLMVREAYTRLQDTLVHSNTSQDSGGGVDVRSGRLVLVGGEVSFNVATESHFGSRAGAVNMDASSGVFVRSGTRFESNSAQAFGGAIQVPGFLSVEDAVFVSNSAATGGAIFLFEGGSAYFRNTQFLNNSAQDQGGAIFSRGRRIVQDAILILTASTFEGNEVSDNENGFPVVVNEGVFLRESLGTFTGNSPNNEIGFLG